MKYHDALEIAGEIKSELSQFCKKVEIAGSIRRKKAEVNDIEIVAIPSINKCYELKAHLYNVQRYSILKGSFPGRYMRLQQQGNGAFIDLFFTTERKWWMIFLIRTGNADFSRFMVTRARKLGYRVKEGLLYDENDIAFDITSEERIFSILCYPWLPPEKRNMYYEGYETFQEISEHIRKKRRKEGKCPKVKE